MKYKTKEKLYKILFAFIAGVATLWEAFLSDCAVAIDIPMSSVAKMVGIIIFVTLILLSFSTWLYIHYYKYVNRIQNVAHNKLTYAKIFCGVFSIAFATFLLLVAATPETETLRAVTSYTIGGLVPIFGLFSLVYREREFTFPLLYNLMAKVFNCHSNFVDVESIELRASVPQVNIEEDHADIDALSSSHVTVNGSEAEIQRFHIKKGNYEHANITLENSGIYFGPEYCITLD